MVSFCIPHFQKFCYRIPSENWTNMSSSTTLHTYVIKTFVKHCISVAKLSISYFPTPVYFVNRKWANHAGGIICESHRKVAARQSRRSPEEVGEFHLSNNERTGTRFLDPNIRRLSSAWLYRKIGSICHGAIWDCLPSITYRLQRERRQ